MSFFPSVFLYITFTVLSLLYIYLPSFFCTCEYFKYCYNMDRCVFQWKHIKWLQVNLLCTTLITVINKHRHAYTFLQAKPPHSNVTNNTTLFTEIHNMYFRLNRKSQNNIPITQTLLSLIQTKLCFRSGAFILCRERCVATERVKCHRASFVICHFDGCNTKTGIYLNCIFPILPTTLCALQNKL